MKILIIAPSLRNTSPGSRFRIEQWMKFFERQGIRCEYAAFEDERLHNVIYQHGNYSKKAYHMLRAVARRVLLIRDLQQYDAVFMFEEASRIGPAVLERFIHATGLPMIYDFCDPIYLPVISERNSYFSYLKCAGKTATICRLASIVLVGNPDLAAYARRYNENVFVVPITIDTEEYLPRTWLPFSPADYVPSIGWSGSHSTVKHLDTLRHTLRDLRQLCGFRLNVLGTAFYNVEGVDVLAAAWSPQRELSFLQECDIGIMPLPSDEWTRLRSHLKVRQYMGVGVPCVASPVGVIPELIEDGVNGFLASTPKEWIEKLSALIEDSDLRRTIGEKARRTIEERYSAEMWAGRVLQLVRSVAMAQRRAA